MQDQIVTSSLGGAKGNRTPDLLNAIQALSQLSYGPPSERRGISAQPLYGQGGPAPSASPLLMKGQSPAGRGALALFPVPRLG